MTDQNIHPTAENYDETDIDTVLDRDTEDGPGEGDVPDSDFVSYEAGEDVSAFKREDVD